MEVLFTLDDEVVDRIFDLQLLDITALENLTADQVYGAAEAAILAATREGHPSTQHRTPQGDRDSPSAQHTPTQNRPLARGRPSTTQDSYATHGRHPTLDPYATAQAQGPATEHRPPGSGRQEPGVPKDDVIGPAEKKNILADSEAEDEPDTECEGEPCIACRGGSGPKRQLSCGCHYCAACLRRCIRAGLRNEEDWPPRCHERLTADDIRWVNRPALLHLWTREAREWDTPALERVYCSRPECAEFIPDVLETGEARCDTCGNGTCPSCRKRWHPGVPCQEVDENEALMDMMDERGFASCDGCKRIVELRDGCNHIT